MEERRGPHRDKIVTSLNIAKLQAMQMSELNHMARELGVENFGTMRKHEVISTFSRKTPNAPACCFRGRARSVAGRFRLPALAELQLSALPGGHLRFAVANPPVRSANRQFDRRPDPSAKEKEKFFALLKVESVDAEDPDKAKEKPILTISRRCFRTSGSSWKPPRTN